MDPMSMVKTMLSKKFSPQQIVNQMMQNNQNPLISNLMKEANNGNPKAVENFARNLCKQKNINFDDEFAKFMNQFK